MKNIFSGFVLAASIFFVSCNSGDKGSKKNNGKIPDSAAKETLQLVEKTVISETISAYVQLKNALANDDGKEAAAAGNTLLKAVSKIDKSVFTPDQKKEFDELEEDMKENAEHIGANANKIDHQREHFGMLSEDIYDLAKTFNAGQTLYIDYCPMYNSGKGAIWVSEIKEIKNPYMGKKMPACGSIKEEIK